MKVPTLLASCVLCLGVSCTWPWPASADLLIVSGDIDNILRYDRTTGAYKGVFASHPRLDSPYGIVADPAGRIYVGGGNTGSVVAFDGQTGSPSDSSTCRSPRAGPIRGSAASATGGSTPGRWSPPTPAPIWRASRSIPSTEPPCRS